MSETRRDRKKRAARSEVGQPRKPLILIVSEGKKPNLSIFQVFGRNTARLRSGGDHGDWNPAAGGLTGR